MVTWQSMESWTASLLYEICFCLSPHLSRLCLYCRVGDTTKELSAEFPLTLRTSIKPGGQFTFPLK